jgi:hypothetical protein
MQVIARSHATSTHAVATAVAEAGLESVTAIQAGKALLAAAPSRAVAHRTAAMAC